MRSATTGTRLRRARRDGDLRLGLLVSSAMLVAGGAAGLPGTALADTSTARQAAYDGPASLDEVVVTARKRSEDVEKVPESIRAVGSRELRDAHVTRIEDLGNLVPNLNITTRNDQTPDVVLRGVGAFGVVNGVGFYMNDVQLFDGQTVRPEDLERVEVLKGPQGTLYGGSNIGGAIKYVTKLPTEDLQGEVTAEYGQYATRTVSAAVSGPLIADKLGIRISAYDTATGGYIYDPILDRKLDRGEEKGGRLTLEYKGDDTRVILYLDGDLYSTSGANLYYRPKSPTDYSLNSVAGTLPYFHRGFVSPTLNITHDLGNGVELTSISSYFRSHENVTTDIDKGPFPILTGHQRFKREVWSEELRLSGGGGGPFRWLAGAYVQGNDPELLTDTAVFNGNPTDPAQTSNPALYSHQFTNVVETHREYAAFGNAQYDVGKLTFEGGLRVDYNKSTMADPLYGLTSQQSGTQILPKASITYHASPETMTYVTVSRGFEPGGLVEDFDPLGNPLINQYRPESTWNYEVGIKSRPSSAVTFNAAAFYLSYKDRLFQTYRLEATQFVQVTTNIGASHNYGVEGDVTVRLAPGLTAMASAGFTKAIWDDITVFDPDLGIFTNLKGRTAPYTPAYQATLSLDWTHELVPGLSFGARVDATAYGQHFWDVTDHFKQEAYRLVNVGLRLEHEHWTLSGHVSNLFDTRYNTAWISAAEVGAPNNVGGIGRPRFWSVAVSYRY